jgi:predicted DCC family thiol-disulfide oxidoreductase YuxK
MGEDQKNGPMNWITASEGDMQTSVDQTPMAAPLGYEIEVFFDGDCPLCVREIDMLQRKDAELNRIRFTDISSSSFEASDVGKAQHELMAQIHGRLENGEWVTGVEVFRRLYAAVGYRRLAALSRAPGISQLLHGGYALFAANRLRLTGRRCDAEGCAA